MMFVLYDGRAKLPDGEDRAMVLDTTHDEAEARTLGSTMWKDHDAIWIQYDEGPPTQKGDDYSLTNPRKRPDLPPCGGAR